MYFQICITNRRWPAARDPAGAVPEAVWWYPQRAGGCQQTQTRPGKPRGHWQGEHLSGTEHFNHPIPYFLPPAPCARWCGPRCTWARARRRRQSPRALSCIGLWWASPGACWGQTWTLTLTCWSARRAAARWRRPGTKTSHTGWICLTK